jgi:hypothetical protein
MWAGHLGTVSGEEFVHHYITSNSTLSTAIDTTSKTTANGSKIATTRLHFSHQRHGGKCVPSPPLAELPNKTALGFFFPQLVQVLRAWGAVPLRCAVSL